MKFMVLLLLTAMLIIPVSASNPVIDTWYNNKTNNNTQNLTIYIDEIVKFNVTANQSIDEWNWSKNGLVQINNYDNFTTSWNSDGNYNISVNATNNTNTSNTITWNVTVLEEETEFANPEITSWYNNKTNNDAKDLTVNVSETVKFNVTANQSIDMWNWTKDGVEQDNNYDNFSTSWDSDGKYNISVNATNNTNGTSDTITWTVTVQEEEAKDENATNFTWSPQVVDYVYVNDTINETITYSIITEEPMTEFNWTVDGIDETVNGTINGKCNYSLQYTWDNQSLNPRFHTVVFTGNNTESRVEFRWHVNVYDLEFYKEGNIFDIMDDALEDHATEIKIRMFKRNMNKHNLGVDYFAQQVNRLHDENAKRQMTREALRKELKQGDITQKDYVDALKQAQIDAKNNSKRVKDNSKPAKANAKPTNNK